jgi:hypothetical protein
MNEQARTGQNALQAWLKELLHGPEQSAGDYFERLRLNIESSAPVRGNCHS